MRALVQRATRASVTVEGETIGAINDGFLILLGVGHEDTEAQADKLWSKISKMRIFEDENGKTNLSLADVRGEVLVVSQFTLYANCKRGNRPSFTDAGAPDEGKSPLRVLRKPRRARFGPRGNRIVRRDDASRARQ